MWFFIEFFSITSWGNFIKAYSAFPFIQAALHNFRFSFRRLATINYFASMKTNVKKNRDFHFLIAHKKPVMIASLMERLASDSFLFSSLSCLFSLMIRLELLCWLQFYILYFKTKSFFFIALNECLKSIEAEWE